MGSLSRTFAVCRSWIGLLASALGGLALLASASAAPVPSSDPEAKAVRRHIQLLDEDELLKQLAGRPEIAINETPKDEAALRKIVRQYSKDEGPAPRTLAEQHYSQFRADPIIEIQKERWKALGIRPIDKDNVYSSAEAVRMMASLAGQYRRAKVVSTIARDGELEDAKPAAGDLPRADRIAMPEKEGAEKPTAVPTLMQMLQPERGGTRALLIRELAQLQTEGATLALARTALFDTSPTNREKALGELKGRPIEPVRMVLLEGLRHPWAPAAQHAAEALVALEDRGAIPALQNLLDEPGPLAPFTPEGEKQPVVRELVRVNHLKNCLLCHAASASPTGLLIGLVPSADEQLRVQYYASRRQSPEDIFARADVVYVRQEFSVTLPVENAKPWPSRQRFDFVVRTSPATEEELASPKKEATGSPHREAILYALQELKAPSEAELTADKP